MVEDKTKLTKFVSTIARMTKDGECANCGSTEQKNPECNDHKLWEANVIDSFETLESLITKARTLNVG